MSGLALSHYLHGESPLAPYSESQASLPHSKPNGLWVSVDGDDWAWWCASEHFRDMTAATRYSVELTPGANLLHLTTAEALDTFTAEFGVDIIIRPSHLPPHFLIDWAEVARRWQGIVIAPYQWSRRLNGHASNWYYGWDCASGCIWDVTAINSVRQVVPT